MHYLLAILLLLPTVQAASSALNGEVFVAVGTTGTNALPSSRTTNTAVSATSTAGATTTAYNLGTSITHTSGDLVALSNNATNQFTVAAVSGYTGTGQKFLSDDGKHHSFLGAMISNMVVISTNLTAGTYDLYTVPTGQRAIVYVIMVTTTNATPGTIIVKAKLTNGVAYRLSIASSLNTNSATIAGVSSPYAFEEGESYTVTTSTTGASIFLSMGLYSTNAYFKTTHVLLTNGTTTVYTCPSGYIAAGSLPYAQFVANAGINYCISQDSGASLSYGRLYNGLVTAIAQVVATNSPTTQVIPPLMAGDTIAVTSTNSDATQFAWFTCYEAPVP